MTDMSRSLINIRTSLIRVIRPFYSSQIGQTHGEIERFIKEQMRQQLIIAVGEAKVSKVESILR